MTATDPPIEAQVSVLAVDDDDQTRQLVKRMLETAGYLCSTAASGEEARALLSSEHVDLLVCDIHMPGEGGLDLISALRAVNPEMGVLVLTGDHDRLTAERASELGAGGYLLKPFDERRLLIEITNALHRRRHEEKSIAQREQLEQSLADRNIELERANAELRARNEDLQELRLEMIQRLARVVDARDADTGRHIARIGKITGAIGSWIGLDPERRETIRLAAPMHDIGKLGISDAILRKPGPLTSEERAEMERHTGIGYGILAGSGLALLDLAAEIALTHHEHWDGNGYPRGLVGEQIPIEGRIAAVADVLDALLNDRVYRPAMTPAETLAIIRDGRGSHFDPLIIDTMFDHLDELMALVGDSPGVARSGTGAAERRPR